MTPKPNLLPDICTSGSCPKTPGVWCGDCSHLATSSWFNVRGLKTYFSHSPMFGPTALTRTGELALRFRCGDARFWSAYKRWISRHLRAINAAKYERAMEMPETICHVCGKRYTLKDAGHLCTCWEGVCLICKQLRGGTSPRHYLIPTETLARCREEIAKWKPK